MKFMLLIHHDEETFGKRPEAERHGLLQESVQLAQQLHASGHYLGAAPLHPSLETTCVRVRDGRSVVTDGPFAEMREQVGGISSSTLKIGKRRSRLPLEFPARESVRSKSGP
jgi:hypothetical protein